MEVVVQGWGGFGAYIMKFMFSKMGIFVVLAPPVSSWPSLLKLVVQGNYYQARISIRNPHQQAVSLFCSLGGPVCGEHRCREHTNKLERAVHPSRGRWNMAAHWYQDAGQKGYLYVYEKYIPLFQRLQILRVGRCFKYLLGL